MKITEKNALTNHATMAGRVGIAPTSNATMAVRAVITSKGAIKIGHAKTKKGSTKPKSTQTLTIGSTTATTLNFS
jgi:hypothetical protein